MSLDDDTLRRLLAARTPGEWEMRPRMWEDEEYYVEVRGAPPGYLGCRYHNVGGTWEPVADAQLWAAAPALAAEVLRLRAERDVLRHERDEHAHKAGEWEESHDIELARAEMVEAAARAHLAADDALRAAYLDAVRARLDADAAVVAAAVAWRRAASDVPAALVYAEQEAWDAARRRRMDAARAEQTALHAYEREQYSATYGHEGRP